MRVVIIILIASVGLYSCKKDYPRQSAVVTISMDKPTAVANGKVIDLGQTTITDHGFCWDSMGFPTVGGKTIQMGKLYQTGNFSGKIPGLSPSKVYYLKAWVSSENDVFYGELISFTTPDLPTVILQTPAEITDSSTKCSVDVSADGGSPVISRGLCWNTQQNPDTINFVYHDSIHNTGSFSHTISGLAAGTKYYARAFAGNLYGFRYSDESSFTTAQSATIPVVTTADISNIGINTVTSGGNITSDGGASVTIRGVCWSTNPYPTIDQNKTTDGNGTGIFVSSITGLTANTAYYLRAYATNAKGTAYGEEKTFNSLPNPGVPTVITSSVTNITSSSATSGGTVLTDGGAGVTARGVCWSVSPNPTTSNTHTLDGSGVGSFSSDIISLASGTKYYVCAYATNSVGTAYGNEVSFTAGQNITAPTVTTTEVVNIAQTNATCGGNVTSDGGATVTVRGVCWSTAINPTTASSHTTDGSGTGGYLSSITGLTANTTYYVRAYATNSAGTSYGNEKSFLTLTEITIPAVTTAPVINVTNNSATSGGTVTNDGGVSVVARGVCWSTSYNPTIADPHTADGTGTGGFVSQISSLLPNTFYRVRAYATNSAGTAYGNQQTFSTLQNPTLPTVSTIQALNITSTTATSGGTVNSDGGAPVTIRGVCYSTSPNPTLANSHTSDGTGTGTFVSNLTGLTPNTLYYVKAYATNSVGTSYGNEITFTTLTSVTLATVTTAAASNITANTATSGGNVSSDGGTTVTVRGVCWSITTNPTTSGSHTTDGTGIGTFISNLTGLTASTLYYVRAYATNSVGTAYGNEVNFTTLAPWSCGSSFTINHIAGAVAPVTKTVTYGTVTNIPGETSKCWITSNLGADHQATAVNDATEASAGWYWQFNRMQGFKHDGTTRTPNTTWITTINENLDWQTSNDPCTLELGSTWRLPTYSEWNNVDASGNWTDWNGPWNSGLKMHAAGYLSYLDGSLFHRGSSSNYWSSTKYDGPSGWDLTFSSETSYMFIYDKTLGFTLRCLQGTPSPNLPTVSTTSISNIAQTTATSGGNVTSDGGATVTARGVCWSTSSNPTTANSHTSDGSGIGTFISSLTALTANTLYYVRAYATNNVGTAYGNEVSFTTLITWSCGSSFTINHIAGAVAPVTKTVTYGTVTNIPGETSKCWITSNLGADHQATAVNDATEASAGWYWQFNRKQGYKHDGTTRTPNTTWITDITENLDWQITNDPCSLELGAGWRLPTATEWTNVDASGNWTDWNGPWNSGLKMHAAGNLIPNYGSMSGRGLNGDYWSSTQSDAGASWRLDFSWDQSWMISYSKVYGIPLRCIKE